MNLPRAALFAAVLLLGPALAIEAGQTAPPAQADDAALRNDSDPTRPVFFSIRPEFYAIADGVTQRALIGRGDAVVLPARRLFKNGPPGVIIRVEVPLVGADIAGQHEAGVGDVYGQALVVPYAKSGFMWALGSGLVVPTASDDRLGGGKLVLAPIVAPVWRLPRGMFFVKVQNFTSVAGDVSRADVNHLLITPLFIHAVGARWWVLVDSETKTSWTREGRTGVKSGLQIGRRIAPGVGFWIKPEAWWGPNRDGQWNLKFGLVWYQRPAPGKTS